jgi:hypothetical protein
MNNEIHALQVKNENHLMNFIHKWEAKLFESSEVFFFFIKNFKSYMNVLHLCYD